jgi:protein involved in polysaccharide export with SLBB domain
VTITSSQTEGFTAANLPAAPKEQVRSMPGRIASEFAAQFPFPARTPFPQRRFLAHGKPTENRPIEDNSGASTILNATSVVGGLSEDADRRQSIGLRGGENLAGHSRAPVRAERPRTECLSRPNLSTYAASTSFNSAYVIGEIQHPGKVTWEGKFNLMASGFTTKAKKRRWTMCL